MAKTLTFSLDNIEEIKENGEDLYEKAKKSRFAKVKIKLFGTGENTHTEPVDFETLQRSADSAYDIPLIAELNPYRGNKDFGGHGTLTGQQFSFGFIKESKDNPIVFEKDEKTGKIFITLKALIWKKYFKNIVDILLNNDNKTEVSVELEELQGQIADSGKLKLHQFVLNAVTFLGKVTTAACQGAMAELCFSEENFNKFKQDKIDYIRENFGDNTIEISNEKENAVNGRWNNPRQKLLSPILKSKNKIALLNEAYLFYEKDEVQKEINLSEVSYPHHVIKDGKLVLHIRGVQSAFSRLVQQGKMEGEAKAHLIRHYKTLGLSKQNFEDFGLTSEQFELYFSTELRKEENMSEETKEINESCEEKAVKEECVEKAEDIKEENSQEEACDSVKEACDSVKEACDCEEVEGEDKDCSAEEKTFEELKEENEKLKAENEAYLAKITEMSDYEDLKKFKADTLEKESKMAEMAEMTNVMKSLETKGVKMSEELKTELINSRNNFANISAWSNYVKAYVFDNCEISNTEDGIVKFDIIKPETEIKDDGVWAKLMNKINK